MSKLIAEIPLEQIERIDIHINAKGKSLAQVKADTGADYVMNGGLFEGSKAVCHLKANGYVYAADPYTYWGFAWDFGADISLCRIPVENRRNHIACVDLISFDRPNPKPIYNADLGGTRGRTAIGLKAGKLCLYVSSDGSGDARTPEKLRDDLAALGWQDAVMLDGGGSSQCDFAGQKITSTRAVHNLILVYLKKDTKKEDTPMSTYKPIVCLDPGHGPDTVNGSPDGTYKEREFAWDMYLRIKPLLETCGVTVICTRSQNTKPSLTARCNVSNNARANLFVSLHTDATAGVGWIATRGLHIITSSGPETANRNKAAAAMLEQFKAAGVVLRGTPLHHSMSLTVLTGTTAPACLIEYGFHTNREDVELLKSAAYRDKLAVATVKGICTYLGIAYKGAAAQEPVAPPAPAPEPSEWDKERAAAWAQAKSRGIMDGTNPEGSVTREQFAVVLARLGLI